MKNRIKILILGLLCWFVPATSQSTTRPIVIEDFTATWCSYCFGVNKALAKVEQMMEDVIVIEYHVDDEFSFAESNQRSIDYKVEAFPTVMINGVLKREGGSSKAEGYYAYNFVYLDYAETITQLKKDLAQPPIFELDVYGSLIPNDCELHTVIKAHSAYPNPLDVIVLLVQDNIFYQAANGLDRFNAVVIQWIARETLEIDAAGVFELDTLALIDEPEEELVDIRPVVLLQDQATKEIVMAVDRFTPPAAVNEWQLHP